MAGYFRSLPGRFLLVGVATFLVGQGLACLLSPASGGLVAGTLSPLLAVVFGIVAVGLGMEDHPVVSLLLTVIGPVALWVGSMGATILQAVAPAWGHAMISAGVLALAAAVVSAMTSPRRRTARVDAHAR